MVIREEVRSIPLRLKQTPLKSRLKESRLKASRLKGSKPKRRLSIGLLGVATTLSAMLISSNQATALPTRLSQTALVSSSVAYPAVDAAQISTSADNSAWLYQGIVQLSYAGLIAWVIALLQNSRK